MVKAPDLRTLITSRNRFEYVTDKQVQVHAPTPSQSETDTNKGTNYLASWKDVAYGVSGHIEETVGSESPEHFKTLRSRDDMVQKVVKKPKLSKENNNIDKETFVCVERVKGQMVNILDGLVLHHNVFSSRQQEAIVKLVYDLQKKGIEGKLKERTFIAPLKWMKGKGRVTIQFGCCYNYATDTNGNKPGILQNELVDPIPPLFKEMITRLVKRRVLPPTCVPDSCIVNIYDVGDCIPPHIDSHDFIRPFCTVSFLSECNILFGSNVKSMGPGEFSGSYEFPLPVGSVLVLDGNGADVAKHCVPPVPTKRISITFRKMDESKWPVGFVPDPDLLELEALVYESDTPKSGSSISKPRSHPSNRQTFRRERYFPENDLRVPEPLAYESGTRKSGSPSSKPRLHPYRTFGAVRRLFASRSSKPRLHPYRTVGAVRRLFASHLPPRSK